MQQFITAWLKKHCYLWQVSKQTDMSKGSIHFLKMECDNLKSNLNQRDVHIKSLQNKLDDAENKISEYEVWFNACNLLF